ncbi:aminotransferase class V-fold PLP-dependent enzyme [Variovorax sp. CT11-76]
MDIYLDANATTPVLPQAREAALAAMAGDFGNPSSIHNTGLKARALMDAVRERARRAIGAPTGRLLFLSGATEGIQTAVLSALNALRARRQAGESVPELLLYGATEHKAVPEALRHWNALLGLDLEVLAIPVGRNGRHDLDWLRAHAPRAGMVCTMAANNETGVVSDLDGIAAALVCSPALWMVDSVQALGKLPLRLGERPIDYAPFSGHKLYAPKGIGLLYVREGAPFTPLMAGGGQEDSLRSGTENMSGIAALGAVLGALEEGFTFRRADALAACRDRLAAALAEAFPGLVFNAPSALCLPTTLNFSVPGLSSKLLLDLFDAADMRVSGGSACGASKARPSYVLEAMGLPAWQTASAVRLSFGPASDDAFIDEACARIRACGESLRQSCLGPVPQNQAQPPERLTRFVVDGACCYLLADDQSRRCVVIDPLPELNAQLTQWLGCHGYTLAAVLDTHSHGDHASSGPELRAAVPAHQLEAGAVDALGWPEGATQIALGALRLVVFAGPRRVARRRPAARARPSPSLSQNSYITCRASPDSRRASTCRRPSISSSRATVVRTPRVLARKPAEGVAPSLASSPPCSAIACAAYSMAFGASSPLAVRNGLSAWRWVVVLQRIVSASQPSSRSSRHMLPRCGMRCAMPSRSSVCGTKLIARAPAPDRPPAARWRTACLRSSGCSARRSPAARAAPSIRPADGPRSATPCGRAPASRCGRPTG